MAVPYDAPDICDLCGDDPPGGCDNATGFCDMCFDHHFSTEGLCFHHDFAPDGVGDFEPYTSAVMRGGACRPDRDLS
jgi:hypothetical protein